MGSVYVCGWCFSDEIRALIAVAESEMTQLRESL